MSRVSRRLVAAAMALAPAGCTSLLPSGGAPPKLYTLTPASDFPPGDGAHVSWQLLVDVPASAATLDTDRIALSRSPTSIDYFADAAWSERGPLMVQSLLVQTFENSGRITAVARESLGLRADYILRAELRHFEADYAGTSNGAPLAHIEMGVKLVKMPDRSIVAGWRCDTNARAAQNQVPAIVDAFDAAMREALRKVVEWTLSAAA
jgi:cholesterol transport system auxiliary component